MKLKIYVLTDNAASNSCKAEHGLSYLIEFDTKVLFDSGQSDLFLQNALKMNAPLEETSICVLSHGHYDHGNGLPYLKRMILISHPDIFLNHYSGLQRKNVGLQLTREEIESKFETKITRSPYWISEKIVYLGEIPRKYSFEKHTTSFFTDSNQPDLLLDDSGMAIVMQQGLFIISGCAHSGICNIVDYARKVTGIKKVFGIMGGFHLKFNNNQTQQTINQIKKWNIPVVMPSHCTELPALSAFYQEFKGEQVRAGTLYTFDEQFT